MLFHACDGRKLSLFVANFNQNRNTSPAHWSTISYWCSVKRGCVLEIGRMSG